MTYRKDGIEGEKTLFAEDNVEVDPYSNLEETDYEIIKARTIKKKVSQFKNMMNLALENGNGVYKYPKAGDYGVKIIVEKGEAHMFRLKNMENVSEGSALRCLELEMLDFSEKRKKSVSDTFLAKATTEVVLKGPGIYNYRKVGVVIVYTQKEERMVMIPYEKFYRNPENYSELIHKA